MNRLALGFGLSLFLRLNLSTNAQENRTSGDDASAEQSRNLSTLARVVKFSVRSAHTHLNFQNVNPNRLAG